eukprot:TRINITY_DN2395_c0_g2_i1.p1 TRINITY_DN2395_c0_g2~~TRINITY_DN2395_c0_g2_i1.p1  ORF type:complete len:172 (-),score=38.08 TRINITY_DN2395_c0_g2_i1:159-674(-)
MIDFLINYFFGDKINNVKNTFKEIKITDKLLQIKQKKKERDIALSTRIASLRDRIYWMSGFYVTMGTISIVRAIAIRKLSPLPLNIVPFVLVPFMIGYQIDAAWGNKMNRIYKESRTIREDEEGWWFNEPLVLPITLKKYYDKYMKENNESLISLGEKPDKDWAVFKKNNL